MIPASLLEHLRSPEARKDRLLVALDFDGTLAPFRRDPMSARLSAARRRLLWRLSHLPGARLLVVSGRPVPFLRARLKGTDAAMAGDHGWQIEGVGLHWRHPKFERRAREAGAIVRAEKRVLHAFPGVRLELKTVSVAAHWRAAAPSVRKDPGPLRLVLERLAPPGWRVAPGHKVWEFRPADPWTKGDAIALAASKLGAARILFVGDDETDEEAFRRLGARAWSVRVGPGPTNARWRVPAISSVDELLRAVLGARA